MAESRREKRFLRLSIFCIGSAASAAITASLVRVDAGPLAWDIAGPLVWGDAGPLVSGQCRPLDPGNAGPLVPGIHPNCFEIQD